MLQRTAYSELHSVVIEDPDRGQSDIQDINRGLREALSHRGAGIHTEQFVGYTIEPGQLVNLPVQACFDRDDLLLQAAVGAGRNALRGLLTHHFVTPVCERLTARVVVAIERG